MGKYTKFYVAALTALTQFGLVAVDGHVTLVEAISVVAAGAGALGVYALKNE